MTLLDNARYYIVAQKQPCKSLLGLLLLDIVLVQCLACIYEYLSTRETHINCYLMFAKSQWETYELLISKNSPRLSMIYLNLYV